MYLSLYAEGSCAATRRRGPWFNKELPRRKLVAIVGSLIIEGKASKLGAGLSADIMQLAFTTSKEHAIQRSEERFKVKRTVREKVERGGVNCAESLPKSTESR